MESLIKRLQKKFVALGIIYLPVAAIIVDTRFVKHDLRPEWEGPWEIWGQIFLKNDPLLGTFFLPRNASTSKSSGRTILGEVFNFSKLEKVVIVVNPPKPK